MDNPFGKPSPEEKRLQEKKQKEREKVFKEAEALANKCLNHVDFVKYRDKYEKLKQITIDSLIDYEDIDPIRYAFNVRTAFAKLHQLKLLIHDVNVDNRPRKK